MTKTISVLHILYELRFSGAEIMLKNAAPYWEKKGVILHALSTAQLKGEFADTLSQEGIIIHHIPYTNAPGFISKLINLIRQYHFDVVQIHVEQNFLTYSIVARLARVPVIIRTIHSTFLFEGTTKFNRTLRRWIVRILGVIQVSVSTDIQKNEEQRFHNPTLQINNWYDDSSFYPPSDSERAKARKKFKVSDSQMVIISVGNCAPVKNHESIVRAIAKLKKENCHIEYWHVGEEDDAKLEQNLVTELDLNGMVKFWGRQNNVRDFLWAADIFIMPSLHEGLSIAMLEAVATGIPIILTKVPGLSQWASVFVDLHFSEPNSDDLSLIINYLLNTRPIRRKIEATYLSSNYGIIQGTEKYYGLYSKRVNK